MVYLAVALSMARLLEDCGSSLDHFYSPMIHSLLCRSIGLRRWNHVYTKRQKKTLFYIRASFKVDQITFPQGLRSPHIAFICSSRNGNERLSASIWNFWGVNFHIYVHIWVLHIKWSCAYRSVSYRYKVALSAISAACWGIWHNNWKMARKLPTLHIRY